MKLLLLIWYILIRLLAIIIYINQRINYLLLFPNNGRKFGINDARIELAAHERGALVVFDVAVVDVLGQLDVLAEALLLEVADGVLVGECEKVQHVVLDVVVFDVVHQVGAVALDLFRWRDGTEDDLRESLHGEHSEADATDRPVVFDQRQRPVFAISIKQQGRRKSQYIQLHCLKLYQFITIVIW